MEYNLCRAADEEAHDPPHDVWREAVLAEKGMEPVMPQVVEGAGQIQEGSRGAAAAVEVIDLTALREKHSRLYWPGRQGGQWRLQFDDLVERHADEGPAGRQDRRGCGNP